MFALNKCLVHSCNNLAISTIDTQKNITNEKNYCLDHSPDPGKIQRDIYEYINTHDKIVGLCAAGITFQDITFSDKQFFGCNFMNCTFKNIHSIFDFAVFSDCKLIDSNIKNSSLAGATFFHTIFTGSELFQTNFNGINAFQSSFDDSNLKSSTFIKSTLENTSFRNCNIKNTNFLESKRTNVSFKMSNDKEAIIVLTEEEIKNQKNS